MQYIKNLFSLILLSLLFIPVCAQSESYQLSTHILDISKGKPAEGMSILSINRLQLINGRKLKPV